MVFSLDSDKFIYSVGASISQLQTGNKTSVSATVGNKTSVSATVLLIPVEGFEGPNDWH